MTGDGVGAAAPVRPTANSVRYSSTNVSLGPAGADPDSEVFDPLTGQILVAFGSPDAPLGPTYVAIVSVGNDSLLRTVTLGPSRGGFADYLPGGLALDSKTGAILVARGPNEVAVLSDSTGEILRNLTVGAGPTTIAFDPRSDEILVANQGSNNLTVFNGSSYRFVETLRLNFPYSVTLDPETNEIDVIGEAGLSGHWYAEGLYDSNDSVAWSVWPTLSLSSPSLSAALDPENGYLYVPTTADQVQVLNAANGASVGTVDVGSDPSSAAICSGPNAIVVTNSGSNNVTIINATDNATRTVTVGGDPQQVVCTGSAAFISNADTDTLSVLNATSGQVIATLRLGDAPWAMAYPPSLDVVLSAGGQGLYELGTSSGSEVANVTVGPNPQSIVFAPTTGRVYVSNAGDGTLSTLTTSPLRVSATSSVGDDPIGVAFDNDTGQLVVALAGSAEAEVVSPLTGSALSTTPVGGFPDGVLFDPDDNALYVTNFGSANVSVLSATTYAVEASIDLPFGSGPAWPALDPSNGQLFIPDRDSGNITVISTSSRSIDAEIPSPGTPFQATYDSHTGLVYVTNPVGGNITEIDPNSDRVVGSIPAGELPFGIACGGTNGTLYVANEMSDTVEILTPEPVSTSVPPAVGDLSLETLALSIGVGAAMAAVIIERRRRTPVRLSKSGQ
jgi:YVTN family beta-propeller protein